LSPEGAGVTGIVLAGGRSSRFTDRGEAGSKLDADLGGRTVLDRTIDAAVAACRDVVVVGRTSGSHPGARYLADPASFEGPLAGIIVGLASASEAVAVVLGGDSPLAKPAVLAQLAGRLDDPAFDAAVLADGDGWRPLPLAIRRDASRDPLQRAFDAGERSIRWALAGVRLGIVPEPAWRAADPTGDTLLDIDTPAELAVAQRRFRDRA